MNKEGQPVEKRPMPEMPDLSAKERSDLFFAAREATIPGYRQLRADLGLDGPGSMPSPEIVNKPTDENTQQS